MKTDVLLKNYTAKALDVMDKILLEHDLPSPIDKGFEYNDISVISQFNLGLNWRYLDELLLTKKVTIEQVRLGSSEVVDMLLAYNEKYDRRVDNGLNHAQKALDEYRTSSIRIALELANMAEEYYDGAIESTLTRLQGHELWDKVANHQLVITQDTRQHNIARVISKVNADLEDGTLNLSIEKAPALLGLQRYFNHYTNNPEYFGIIFRSTAEVVFDYVTMTYGNQYVMEDVLTACRVVGGQNVEQIIETILND